VIAIRALSKSFGLKSVLRGIDLSVAPGEFVALLGPNGAGKTTLLRIVATLSRPNTGEVKVGGLSLTTHASAARRLLGVVSHQPLLYGELTAEENLRFYARMYRVEAAETRISAVLDQVGLARQRRDLVRTFSRGMQQRLAIARATLHQPQVMLFDEPHTGLDQDAATMLDDVLRSVTAAGRTVMMITHDLARGLALSDRVAILRRGKIACEADSSTLTPAAFADQYYGLVHA